MSCRAVKDVGGRGTGKEGDVTKYLLDLTHPTYESPSLGHTALTVLCVALRYSCW